MATSDIDSGDHRLSLRLLLRRQLPTLLQPKPPLVDGFENRSREFVGDYQRLVVLLKQSDGTVVYLDVNRLCDFIRERHTSLQGNPGRLAERLCQHRNFSDLSAERLTYLGSNQRTATKSAFSGFHHYVLVSCDAIPDDLPVPLRPLMDDKGNSLLTREGGQFRRDLERIITWLRSQRHT